MSNRVITPEAMLSYPHLWRPQAPMAGDANGKSKYSAVLVFAEGADLGDMKRATIEVAKDRWGDKAAGMIRSGKLRFPFRTDDDKGYPEGSTFITARSESQPGIVSIYPDKDGRPSIITDEDEVYPGCIVRASVSFFAYDHAGNKGVGAALNNVQKLRDGDRLDGRVKATDEFDADMDAVADLGDLTDESESEDIPAPKKAKGKKASKAARLADDDGEGAEDDLADLLK